MEKWILLITSALFLSSCAVSFRSPVCDEGEFQFPAEHYGVYRISVPQTHLGKGTKLDGVEFEVGPDGFKVDERGLGPLSGFDVTPDTASSQFTVCEINGRYYSQQVGKNSLYEISQMGFSNSGMSMTAMGYDAEELEAAGIAYSVMPTFQHLENSSSDGFSIAPFLDNSSRRHVIDNRAIDRKHLVQHLRPSALSYFIEKVSMSPEDWRRGKTIHSIRVGGVKR